MSGLLGLLGLTSNATSTAINKSLTDIQNDISSLVSTSSTAAQTISNAINVTDIGGDITIDSSGQYTDAQQDINTVSDTSVNTQIQNKVMEAIKQAAKTEGGLSLPGTSTNSLTETEAKTLIGTHINVQSIINNTNTQTLSNVLNANKIRGNVKISNFNQTVKAKMYVTGYAKTMQTLGVTIDTSRSIDQSATSDAMPIDNIIDSVGNAISKVLSSAVGMGMLLVIGCCVAGLVVFWKFSDSLKITPEKVKLIKYILIVVLIIAVIALIAYMATGSSKKEESKSSFVTKSHFVGDAKALGGYNIF